MTTTDTKTSAYAALQASVSNGAGATTTGSGVDLTTKFGGVVTLKITNGATGPTIGCVGNFDISGDNSAFKLWRSFQAGIANSGVYEFSTEVPPGIMYIRSRFTGNTGQAVTVEAFIQEFVNIVQN